MRQCVGVLLLSRSLAAYINTIRAAPIRVRGVVVVVGVACGVDVPRIVSVATIR